MAKKTNQGNKAAKIVMAVLAITIILAMVLSTIRF